MVIPRQRERPHGRWTAGIDVVGGQGAVDHRPRLHAVGSAGLVSGRGICLSAVTLLDPADWTWPDDGAEDLPLCWICLALTHPADCDDASHD